MRKMIFVTMRAVSLSLIMFAAVSAQASGRGVVMKKNVYSAICQLTEPLYTYSNCSEGSYLGTSAAECAQDQAMDNCQAENNVDCVVTGVTVWAENSSEFVGYKRCMAKARVHGYEVVR